MLKIGVIGIGSIAEKAYLPVYSKLEGVEFHFCTRNLHTLEVLRSRYRWTHLYRKTEDLIESGIDAAFIHAATPAHPIIAEQLLNRGISVYIDKPIADHYETAVKLTEMAESNHALLMTGFNRRFAPLYQELFSVADKSMIVYQKNRVNDPKDIRTFVFDDFIHVVDSIRFLLQGSIDSFDVHVLRNIDAQYAGLSAIFHAGEKLAIAVMNRLSGANEEILQVMSPDGEHVIRNLTEEVYRCGTTETVKKFGDWTATLYKRGFPQIIKAFLDAVKNGGSAPIAPSDALETHRICEEIVQRAEKHSC